MMIVKKISHAYLLVTVSLSKNDNFQKLNRLPEHKKWVGRDLKVKITPSNISYLYEHWPESEWQGDANDLIVEHLKDVTAALDRSGRKHISIDDDGSYEYKLPPFDHQRQCFLFSRELPYFAILGEMGTGKTKILIDTTAYLYKEDKIDFLIVIAPNGVHRNWVEIEIPAHIPGWCNHSADFYSSKHLKKRTKDMMSAISKPDHLNILTMNVEGFASERAKTLIESILKNNRCMVILDESTTIKNNSAKRTKYILSTCEDAEYKRIATGAPITKGVEDLFPQFKFLSPSIIGYKSYIAFKNQYCEEIERKVDYSDGSPNAKKYKVIVDYKNIDDLISKIDPYSMRFLKKDCLDLPEKVYTKWAFEMSPEQKRVYNELKNDFISEIQNTNIEEELAIVRLMRLQQIACGFYPDEDGNLHPFPGPNRRIEALKEICNQVDENKEKAIIWSRFKNDIYQIEDLLGDRAVSYHGDVSDDDRSLAARRFQGDDKIKYMIAMLSSNSGAVRGHTWTAASTTVYYSNYPDLDARLQSEDRMHRWGIGDKALYIDLMALGTIDRKTINCLIDKKSIADMVTGDGPSGFLNFIND